MNSTQIRELVENTPAEEFNKYKRSCGHTPIIKDGFGLCIAQISSGCKHGLAVTQFNGFPCCTECRDYLVQKKRRWNKQNELGEITHA